MADGRKYSDISEQQRLCLLFGFIISNCTISVGRGRGGGEVRKKSARKKYYFFRGGGGLGVTCLLDYFLYFLRSFLLSTIFWIMKILGRSPYKQNGNKRTSSCVLQMFLTFTVRYLYVFASNVFET